MSNGFPEERRDDNVQEFEKLAANVMSSAGWLTDQLRKALAKQGITPQQYHILKILKQHSIPLSTMQLRERMTDKMSDTSRIVERMLLKKLVAKKLNRTDRRLVEISLTQESEELLNQVDGENGLLVSLLAFKLDMKEARQLNELLTKLYSPEPEPVFLS